MELIKISTAGSVDDGKSTLIGRLLYDNGALTHEQLALIEKKSLEKGLTNLDFSVLTDGLIAEREQGITIDVAHVYFSTQTHKFILADSPGHVEYTRNMVTGASNTDTSIILIDARKGLLEQTYRHYFIAHLLRQKKVIFCINKMDLVDFSEDVYLDIAIRVKKMIERFDFQPTYEIIPISSLKGDNVVQRSLSTPWYRGRTLDEALKTPYYTSNLAPFRFSVQQVYHVQNEAFVDYRGYAGRILSGSIRVGDEIQVLPGNKTAQVTEIRKYDTCQTEAEAGDSVVLSLDKDLGIDRGSLFAPVSSELNQGTKKINVTLVWLNEQNARLGDRFVLKAHAFETTIKIAHINGKIDTVSNRIQETAGLDLNDIVEAELQSAQTLFLDAYEELKQNGNFILISPQTNATVALGLVNVS